MKTIIINEHEFEVSKFDSSLLYAQFDASEEGEDISYEKEMECREAIEKAGYDLSDYDFIEFEEVEYPNLFKAVFRSK